MMANRTLRFVSLNRYENLKKEDPNAYPDSHWEFAGYSEYDANGRPRIIELYYYPNGKQHAEEQAS